ncbi:hypothetical protein PG994_002337 [Apiospora phragmitis]|uniref:Ricin B lectin n=1 Tax=Apiospora phragmitis TaxID=2905665 RepID=A0ABR1WW26_9PEZI
MKLSLLATAAACLAVAEGAINWTLEKAGNPTSGPKAMTAAAARHARLGSASKQIRVYYTPGVPTAEANYNGDLRFGSDRAYMNERTALHEVSHTLGVGQTAAFDRKCASGDWATALPLLRSWDGQAAKINCGGSHFWPYGLNYDNEWSETNADRNVLLVNAMLKDGM